jgi:glycosyl transferase family 25
MWVITSYFGIKLFRLYQDRAGAAGYILWPQGAKKLLQCEQKKGIALADAHITDCHNIKAYQVEPTPIIQLDASGKQGRYVRIQLFDSDYQTTGF